MQCIGPPLPGPSLNTLLRLTVIPQLPLHSSLQRHLFWDTICGSLIISHSFAQWFQVSSILDNFLHCIPQLTLCGTGWTHLHTVVIDSGFTISHTTKGDTVHNLFRSVRYHQEMNCCWWWTLELDTAHNNNNNNRNTVTRCCWWGLCGSTTVCRCRSLDVLGEFN